MSNPHPEHTKKSVHLMTNDSSKYEGLLRNLTVKASDIKQLLFHKTLRQKNLSAWRALLSETTPKENNKYLII